MVLDMRQRLVRNVHRLEELELEKKQAGEALKEAFEEASAQGFDRGTLMAILRLRRLTPAQRKERRALEAIYLAALGMLEGDALPEEARRRLSGNQPPPPAPPSAKPEDAKSAGPDPKEPKDSKKAAKPAPAQATLPLKKPEEARAEGRQAASAGKRIYDNPYPAGDPCRAAWDEGWCEGRGSHGMDTPDAYQRRTDPKPEDGGEGKKGEAKK